MLIEIDLTALEDAGKEQLIIWQQGVITMIDIRAKKGDWKAVQAMEVCKGFIDDEIRKREREGVV